MSPASSPPRIVTLIALIGLSVITLNIFAPSLAHMAEDFETSYAMISLSLAGYLGFTAILQLIVGPLSDLYGRRPVLLISMGMFVVASIGCAFAPNIWVFLGFRMLQASIVTANALPRAIVRDMVEEEEAASLMGYMAMAMAIAPLTGPMLGGVLDEVFGWRADFVFLFTLGVIMLYFIYTDLGETNKHRSETFSKQMKAYPELFKSRRFWGYSLCMSFSIGSFYMFVAGAPIATMIQFGLSPSQLGIAMGTISLGFVLGSFISGRYIKKTGIDAMMVIGRVSAFVGLGLGSIIFMLGFDNLWVFFATSSFAGLGNGLTMPSCSVGSMSVRPQLAGSAAGLSGALIVATGALLIILTGWLVEGPDAAYILLGLIVLNALAGLLCALYVIYVNKVEAAKGAAPLVSDTNI